MELVNRIVLIEHRIRNSEQPHIRGLGEGAIQILRLYVSFEAFPPRIDLSDSLLKLFFECTSIGHHFADRLHRRADFSINLRREFGQIPLRDFGHNVIKRRFETGCGGFSDCVGELWECMAKSNLSCRIRERITGSFRCQCTGIPMSVLIMLSKIKTKCLPRSTQPSVNLYDTVFPGLGVQCVLNIALPNYSEMSNNLESCRPKHMVLIVW